MMKRALAFPVVVVLTMMLAACSGITGGADATSLVPANANLIAQIQVSKILNDVDFDSFYQQTPKDADDPQTFNELLDKAERETGVDFREFTAAVLFGDITQDDRYFGIIAEGPVDEGRLAAALEAGDDFELSTSQYGGFTLYTDESADERMTIVVIDGDTAVLGTPVAVMDVIDVHQGNLASLSGPVYDTFKDLGTPLGSMALSVPPEALEELQGSAGGPQGFGMMPAMEALQDITVMAFLIDKLGEELKVEARLGFVSAESAQEMGDTLDGLVKVASAFAPDENVQSLLKRLELTVEATTLTIRFQAPLSEIQEVARSMGQEFDGQY